MNEITFSKQIPGLFAEEYLRVTEFSMADRHFHESLELYFMLEGERYYFIEQDTYHIKPGMAILVNRNQIHKTSMVSGNKKHLRFLLQLDPSVLDSYFSLPEVPDIRSFGDHYWGVAEFTSEEWQQVLFTLDLLKKEMNRTDTTGNTISLLLTMQLITLFVRSRCQQEISQRKSSAASHKVHTGMYQKVHEIALYLQNHCSESCPLDDIAAHFYISRPYLTRIFKSITGFTVTEYLGVCRIRRAKMLLQETNLSITDISAQTGFGNITYFEKVFKKMTDCTPFQYRKNFRARSK